MLSLLLRAVPDCGNASRRELLRVGTLGCTGLTLAELLAREAASAAPGRRKEINCIFLWLAGGPSHLETFDPKPDAPAEVRGPFGTVQTATGERFGELLPRLAAEARRFSVIRSLTHTDNDHDHAQRQVQSGYPFDPGLAYPSYGSVTARELGSRAAGMPPYVLFAGRGSGAEGPGYLGGAHQPLAVPGDPSAPGFSVRDLIPPGSIGLPRADRRRRMLDALDRFEQEGPEAGRVRSALGGTLGAFTERAYSLITSPTAKRAFNLSEEKDTLRERYGRNILGQSCLLARRLIEAGVRFVTIPNGGWDTHLNHFEQVKRDLQPRLDQAYSALLVDLADRGLLDSTLVLALGEFGRTPRINRDAGRDHWPAVFSACLGGGGVRTGMVIGGSDETGAAPASRPVKVEDLAATIYRALRIDAHREFVTPQGRAVPIVKEGSAVEELF
jgi:hypothetical protein